MQYSNGKYSNTECDNILWEIKLYHHCCLFDCMHYLVSFNRIYWGDPDRAIDTE